MIFPITSNLSSLAQLLSYCVIYPPLPYQRQVEVKYRNPIFKDDWETVFAKKRVGLVKFHKKIVSFWIEVLQLLDQWSEVFPVSDYCVGFPISWMVSSFLISNLHCFSQRVGHFFLGDLLLSELGFSLYGWCPALWSVTLTLYSQRIGHSFTGDILIS